MRNSITTLFIVFSVICHADCDAPDLSLKKQNESFLNFKISKLWDDDNNPTIEPRDTKIQFGDHAFLFSPTTEKTPKPKQVNINKKDFSEKLLGLFKSSPHYLGTEKQSFTVQNLQGIDLDRDTKADVILFEVNPGANVYSGAVGILKKEWFTLVSPECY